MREFIGIMTTHDHYLFFADCIDDDLIYLNQRETHHATKVLRIGQNELFSATDGNGRIYRCRHISTKNNELIGKIVETTTISPFQYKIDLFIGLPDRDAFEAVLQHLTAMGISTIIPIECSHCRKRWWDGTWKKSFHRFHQKMLSAMKQSLYPYLPQLKPPVPFSEIDPLIKGTKIVADPNGTTIRSLATELKAKNRLSCFIGPPGGFSDDEFSFFRTNGAHFLTIAPSRLRTELASVVLSAQIISYFMEDTIS